jgi:hypothetical protein
MKVIEHTRRTPPVKASASRVLTKGEACFNVQEICDKEGNYIAGFVDGEGSFNITFRPREDYRTGWKITPVFNVTQKERTVLDKIKSVLNCGTIRARKDGAWVYEVTRKECISNKVIPFFDRFPLWSSSKSLDLEILKLVRGQLKALAGRDNKYISVDLMRSICDSIDRKVVSKNRKYTTKDIMRRCLERSEKRTLSKGTVKPEPTA